MTGRCLGIRRETVNAWERRSPITPNQVKLLVERGVRVIVQPSDRRIFTNTEYESAGGLLREDLSEASLIVGVKEFDPKQLIPEKTYCFFSHTFKAQAANMPMLDACMEKRVQLVDYEMMVDPVTKMRLAVFGRWAGRVGVLNILQGMGPRLLGLGFNTPFLYVNLAHNYRDLAAAESGVKEVGAEIAAGRLPVSLGPLIFVVTGTGNVGNGALDVLRWLPHEMVTVDQLPTVAQARDNKKIYICVVGLEENLSKKDVGGFNLDDYLKHPDTYSTCFATKANRALRQRDHKRSHVGAGPAASADKRSVRPAARRTSRPAEKRRQCFQAAAQVARAAARRRWGSADGRLVAIADVSADIGGSLEFLTRCATVDRPFFIVDVGGDGNLVQYERFDAPRGVLICNVDNMPAQMPLSAATEFAEQLFPYIDDLLKCDAKKPFDSQDVSLAVKNAMETSNGKLTPRFQYLEKMRKEKGV